MYVLKENETEKKRSKILKPLKKSIEARLLKKGIKISIEHEKEEKKKKPIKQSKKDKTLKIEKPEKKEKAQKVEKALKKKKNVQPRQTTSQRVQSTLRSFIDELSAQGIQ